MTFAIQRLEHLAPSRPSPFPNNGTGMLTLNFADGATGIANITVRAFDTDGAFVDDTFKVDFNEAPGGGGLHGMYRFRKTPAIRRLILLPALRMPSSRRLTSPTRLC